jgi:acetyl-CoA C-acetyltransferase
VDLSTSEAAVSEPAAFAEAQVMSADIQYASIYDSFTTALLMQLEDPGFCATEIRRTGEIHCPIK